MHLCNLVHLFVCQKALQRSEKIKNSVNFEFFFKKSKKPKKSKKSKVIDINKVRHFEKDLSRTTMPALLQKFDQKEVRNFRYMTRYRRRKLREQDQSKTLAHEVSRNLVVMVDFFFLEARNRCWFGRIPWIWGKELWISTRRNRLWLWIFNGERVNRSFLTTICLWL